MCIGLAFLKCYWYPERRDAAALIGKGKAVAAELLWTLSHRPALAEPRLKTLLY